MSCVKEKFYMVENICVAVLAVIAVGAAILGWWIENGGSDKNTADDTLDSREEKA
jgi:hypothetical protein